MWFALGFLAGSSHSHLVGRRWAMVGTDINCEWDELGLGNEEELGEYLEVPFVDFEKPMVGRICA